ncbi:MAG: aminotransferase class I/II-fold pyridoxal phosphate-dependent enzyme [Spirochaetales bacterium]|nr:aminotransferase class I/II-fold pyridoxal phosphate-dependent enzyme [Spirochaetales bacterium]
MEVTSMGFFKPFALERFFAKHEFSAKYLLCSSDCESMPIRELLAMEEGSDEKLLDLRLGYTETRGAPSLREAIASHYAGLDPDSVFVHAGAEEAILNLCLALLEPDDRVIVTYPGYQSLEEIPRSLGCETVRWELRETPARNGNARRWFLDPDELPVLSGGKAKIIIMNAPHNPTGALPTRAEFEAIISYARRTGAILFVDEVYRRLEHSHEARLPSVCELYEHGVALDVLSKHSGLAGLRVGWLASRRTDILDAVAVVKDYNSICTSAPSEALAEIAVRNLEAIAARNRTIVAGNLALLDSFFERHPDFALWTRPEAGSIAFPRLAGGGDAEALAERLVAEAGVLLLPGAYYDYASSFFRVGFGRATMPEALEKLESWLED